MRQPDGHYLAELNLGILKHDWEDPRVKDFVDGLDLVNGIAQRSTGFVWMMSGEDMEREQLDPAGPMEGNPRMASTLSIWTDLASLEHFVWNTVHKRYYDRRAEWYDMGAALRFVMWWVPEGHRPNMAEAMARFTYLEQHGAQDFAFDWAYLKSET